MKPKPESADAAKNGGFARNAPRVAGLLLALITLLAYLPATQNGFVNFDDDNYVTANPLVQRGLTVAGVQWAFAGSHFCNYSPLAWLSHMADCDLFRLNPGGHHFVNVLLHSANVLLLFILLRRLTGALWPSAFAAAMFGWHPLHVESVAWIAERKDVLSTCFGLLALLQYEKFARQKNWTAYGLALLFFALSLLSKPMLVTLPVVLLLLDYWPLQRFQTLNFKFPALAKLFAEKIPFFLLSALFCVITVLAQRAEAISTLQRVPLGLRLENAAVSGATYLADTFWPAGLAAFYPLPKEIPWPAVALAVAVLAAVSAVAWRAGRARPYLRVGWLWYLVTLAPVIGLVQVGDQARADRYTYFPLIGIFLALALAADEAARRRQISKKIPAGAAAVILAACLGATEHQLRFWRDSEALFRRDLAVAGDSATAHLNLGSALQQQGRNAEARAEYEKTLRLDPGELAAHMAAYNNLGRLLNDEGKPTEALEYCRTAVRLAPDSPATRHRLGIVLAELGRDDEAFAEFREAIRLNADYAPAHFQIGRTLLMRGRDAEAVALLREAVRLNPDNLQMLIYAARVFSADENPAARNGAEAIALARRAAQLAGEDQPVVLDTLAIACAEAGRFDEAAQAERRALQLAQPEDLAGMRQRLEAFENRHPWRESFAK